MDNLDWWVLQGYPPFDPGTGPDEGHPDPAQVVKYYRKKKLITLKDGSVRTCRQIDLANILDIDESWVRAMENNGKSLDSITRRRALMIALGIPPALLGLASSEANVQVNSGGARVTQTTLAWAKETLEESWELYYSSSPILNLRENIQRKVDYLRIFATLDGTYKDTLLLLEAQFLHVSAKIASDQQDFEEAHKNLKRAIRIATELRNPTLLAGTYFWRGRVYLEQERFLEAATNLDKALKYVPANGQTKPQIPFSLQGAILLEAGLAHAYLGEKGLALSLFSQARPIIQQVGPNDPNFVKINLGRHHQFKAEALIALKDPETALKEVDWAEKYTPSHLTRRRAYLDILRAQASFDLGDFAYAAFRAQDALKMCQSIGSNVNVSLIQGLCNDLVVSPFGNSDEVSKLRISLMYI